MFTSMMYTSPKPDAYYQLGKRYQKLNSLSIGFLFNITKNISNNQVLKDKFTPKQHPVVTHSPALEHNSSRRVTVQSGVVTMAQHASLRVRRLRHNFTILISLIVESN